MRDESGNCCDEAAVEQAVIISVALSADKRSCLERWWYPVSSSRAAFEVTLLHAYG